MTRTVWYLARLDELKEKHPLFFGHPNAKEGEVFLGDYPAENIGIIVMFWQRAGLESVRVGNKKSLKPVEGHPGRFEHQSLFANASVFLETVCQM
ncbi:MAG: hypothetical protein Q8R08_01180 [bacterium]|nr:hypothetical protein [bacterium]